MLADSYGEVGVKPFDIKALDCTRSVRDFLCEYLTDKNLILSYAPNREFGSNTTFGWLRGGWVCAHDKEQNTIIPMTKVNYRVIKALFEAGFICTQNQIKTPHLRCVIFRWAKVATTYQREIVRAHILNDEHSVTRKLVDGLAAQYGLRIRYINARALFEVVRASGDPIQRGKADRTFILANKRGEPVTRFKDMPISEWEEELHRTAVRIGSLNGPLDVPAGIKSHLEAFKRNV